MLVIVGIILFHNTKFLGFNLPLYEYEILDSDGNSTDKRFEITQRMSEDALTKHPETGEAVRRVICIPVIRDGRPAWERCSDVRDHIRKTRPKWVNDKTKGIRERFDPRKHG